LHRFCFEGADFNCTCGRFTSRVSRHTAAAMSNAADPCARDGAVDLARVSARLTPALCTASVETRKSKRDD
jgi:hypothetical protein